MNRSQLEHLIRAASAVCGESHLVVVGSQSILGSIPTRREPCESPSRPTFTRATARSWPT